MKDKSAGKESFSTGFGSHQPGDQTEITNIIRSVGVLTIVIYLVLIITNLISNKLLNVVIILTGIAPIVISLALLRRGAIAFSSIILSATTILLITWMATQGQGIYDIGVLGYPVILIVAGLILQGRILLYLSLLVILCMAWLVFGNIFGVYEIHWAIQTDPEDFFFGSIIILIAGNTIYRLAKNIYSNLYRAEQEIEMRKQAEQEREALIRQLKQKNQELDRFAVRVSHDLKTPLITLAGFLGYMEKDIDKGDVERAKKGFAQINDAAKKMGTFVDELLDLSRVGRITNPPVDVPFDEILQDALKAADGLLKAKQVQVKIEAAFPLVHVDRVRIVQVMQNLIANAVKFMGDQPNPTIRFGFVDVDGDHVFFISDNGVGISPEHHERIFELFNKLDPNTEGVGLGLGLVKKVIEVHGGKIWVESEPGKGSTFRFTLQSKPITKTN